MIRVLAWIYLVRVDRVRAGRGSAHAGSVGRKHILRGHIASMYEETASMNEEPVYIYISRDSAFIKYRVNITAYLELVNTNSMI